MSTTSVSGSSTVNGLYSNANAISGLVSGLDTESMIEGLVDSYNQKIIGYQQSIVSQQWKQSAYRDVISDLQSFAAKYTSLTSQSTNVSSKSFFNSAISTVPEGENSSAVSVSGTTSASVQVNSVLQTATASQIISSSLSEKYNDMNEAAAEEVDLDGETEVGKLSGSMTITYGSTKVSISFSDSDVLDTEGGISTAEAMANLINDKLKDAYVGDNAASTKFEAVADEDGNISFEDKSSGGNSVWISSAGSSLKTALGLETSYSTYSEEAASFKVTGDIEEYVETKDNADLIEGKSITVNYNGASVSLTIPSQDDYDESGSTGTYAEFITADLQSQLSEKFGGEVSLVNGAANSNGLKLEFNIEASTNGNTLAVTSSVGEHLGFGTNGLKNSIQTSDTLDYILGEDADFGSSVEIVEGQTVEEYDLAEGSSFVLASGNPTLNNTTKEYTDSDGDTIVKMLDDDDNEIWVKLNDEGELRVGKEVEINGEVVGVFDGESTLQEVMDAINSSDAGATVSFSTLTNNFVFDSKETGANSAISIGGSLGEVLFGTSPVVDTYKDEVYATKITSNTAVESDLVINVGDYEYKVGDGVLDSGMTYEKAIEAINADLASKDVDLELSATPIGNEDGLSVTQGGLNIYVSSLDGVNSTLTMTSGDTDLLAESKYSSTTREEDTGKSDYLAVSQGQNAIMVATINGEQLVLERSSNLFEVEGLKITTNTVFNNTDENGDTLDLSSDTWTDEVKSLVMDDEITFTQEKDFDEVVEVIRDMVTAYNELMSKVKTYFTETPLTTTSGGYYKPLTDEDSNSMTDAAVESYEEKAKTGILFGDSNMRSLYNSMSSIFSASGAFGVDLNEMGFSVGYGSTSSGDMVDFDEDKLRDMLENDFDKVVNAFTSSTATGAAEDGVMAKLSSCIDTYASVTGTDKGILVNVAGTELSPLSLLSNSMQDKIDSFESLIASWEDKLSNKVDYYTAQFTKLEIIMSNANSQSSALAGLSSGY